MTRHHGCLKVLSPMSEPRFPGRRREGRKQDDAGASAVESPKDLSPLEKIELPTGAMVGRVFSRGWKGQRRRIVVNQEQEASYHIMSRSAGGERLFGDLEKEAFRRLMWRQARFCGVEIRTYAVMDNHFHILARVPSRAKFATRFAGEGGEARLLDHLQLLYSKQYIAVLRAELTDLRKRDMRQEADDLIDGYMRRLCDLPVFAKELKERFSRWFNAHHDRRGSLWMERFKSVLVEDGDALRTMAAYIDLNAVRAGMVQDPKDYRWCGYGEAMGGGKAARLGLCHVVGHGERGEAAWETPDVPKGMNAAEVYRCWLFADAGRPAKNTTNLVNKAGIPTETVAAEKQRKGKLSRSELLRSRVRYFSDGLVIGSKPFVEGVFAEHRSQFSPGRKSGARTLREDVNGSLFTARQLTVRALG